ncbi:Type III-A CRISPR-associated protein Cas10/Csm1 [Candidatus Desulfarcum epimagneticum]|uniref:CRISPR system single-strand-specific deoxyribonuclease Cas10/Csm1 (subtype III-A) n=1 Tax=uncultured Desulfobacteraceae bacterium TaxID=218296 RepID=A0A484HG75_9BACT|nr:Type III-A CRISPR-associated protein Cas10/Csm1 [uncultured Desulfobacteraceae bacterium]
MDSEMIKSGTIKIALAAFMANLGLLAGRGDGDNGSSTAHNFGEWSVFLTKKNKEKFPGELCMPEWGEGESFIELLSGFINPVTPMRKIINASWFMALGIKNSDFPDSLKTLGLSEKDRLFPILEKISLEDKRSDQGYEYCYPLKPVSKDHIFPVPIDDETPDSSGNYEELFSEFCSKIGEIGNKDNLHVWFEHFDSLVMRYVSQAPSVIPGRKRSDISIYDHSKTTAAIASAIYSFHAEDGSLDDDSISDYDRKKFLIISGDFYGIQNFIFTGYGESGKFRSKILRGRSFFVSLLSELSADMVCREFGLPVTSTLISAAGKFIILAPNTEGRRAKLDEVEKKINNWLIKIAYGETLIGFSSVEASCDDLLSANFADTLDRIEMAGQEKKYSCLNLGEYEQANDDYLDRFKADYDPPLCSVCHKRPSTHRPRDIAIGGVKLQKAACAICRDHIFLGTNLVKKASPKDNRLFEKIFGRYQLEFKNGHIHIKCHDKLVKIWALWDSGEAPIFTIKPIRGYVPVHTAPKDQEELRLLEKLNHRELQEEAGSGREIPKTLNYIACMSKNMEGDAVRGTEALGVMKADVDDLGMIMSCGIKDQENNLSVMAAFSRQMNHYFTVFLPGCLESEKAYQNIYTVFAGGDDMFLIGPWNKMIDFSYQLRNKFKQYVCENPEIHFSSGITVHKAGSSIDSIAILAEEALEKSKNESSEKNRFTKNSFTIFSETKKWAEFSDLMAIRDKLKEWVSRKYIDKAMLHRLNRLIELAREEFHTINQKTIHIGDLKCTKWRFMLAYTIERNISIKDKNIDADEKKKEIEQKIAGWIYKYAGSMKIPLWDVLYNLR